MHVIPDASGQNLCDFAHETVAPGAVVHTDGWGPYVLLAKKGFDHRPRSQRAAKHAGDMEPVMPRVHRTISNFESWLRGTYRAVSNERLQVYLDEFVFRDNRRRSPMSAFQSLLGLESQQQRTTPSGKSWYKGPEPRGEPELTGDALLRLCRGNRISGPAQGYTGSCVKVIVCRALRRRPPDRGRHRPGARCRCARSR